MDKLYIEYSKLVYFYLFDLCNNREIAEELTQETFYKAVKGINKFNNECKVSTWLCQIAKNTWIDFLRKEKKFEFISLYDSKYVNNISSNIPTDKTEETISLYRSISKFDEDTLNVFYLRLKGDLTFKEIGKILGRSENWARLIFYRGKIKLKEDMNNET